MEREIQRNVDLMASARDINKRFELVTKKYRQALAETRRVQELAEWQRFFGYERNAAEFFEKLDRKDVQTRHARTSFAKRIPKT